MPKEKISDPYDLEAIDGLGPVTAKKLINAGIHSMYDLVTSSPTEVMDVTSWDRDVADKFITKAREYLELGGFISKSYRTAKDIYIERQVIKRIKTGSESFDDFLGGGLETGSLYETYGVFGSGKTQFCHTICVNVQMPEDQGGLNGGVLYIDSENTFRPERIESIAKARGLKPNDILDKIIVARAHNAGHQMVILDYAGNEILKNNIKLVIIDSVMGNFRGEMVGRGTLAERQQMLNRHLHKLLRIAENYRIVAVATNQAVSDPNQSFGDPTKAAGGNIMAHASTYRIYFKKSGQNRVARFMDSPMHPESEIKFKIAESGITDVDDDKKTQKADSEKCS